MKRTKGLKLGKQAMVWVLALIAIMACVVLAACTSGGGGAAASSAAASADASASAAAEASASAAEEEASASAEATPAAGTPQPDQFGVITADQWADTYPNQYNTYLANAYNVPGYKGEYAEITANEPDKTSKGDIQATADSGKANFLADDQYPEIKVIGKGYGYAKYYTEPGGHTYSIWSIEHNGRLGDVRGGKTGGILACYSCKTPQIHFDAENLGGHESWTIGELRPTAVATDVELKVNEEGKELPGWKQSATNGADYYTENVSCANCHVNDDPGQMNIIRQDWKRVLGKAWESNSLDIPQSAMVCGQCHCDYSMALSKTDTEYNNGEPTSPYEADTDGTLSNMTPEKAYQFYNDHDITDWVYASTGAKMLSIRHAEFEIYYVMEGGSTMRNTLNPTTGEKFNCVDCHMGKKTADDGTEYTSHTWTSPLDDPEISATCDSCHAKDGGIEAYVKDIQAKIDGRNHELGMRYADFIHKFEEKVAIMKVPEGGGDEALLLDEATAEANGIDADKLAQLQEIQREACYYWNLPAADNSEGAHNQKLYTMCLDKLEELLNQGDELLGVTSSAADFEAWNAEQAKAA